MSELFQVGNRVFNTGNSTRKTIGIITKIIGDEYCEVLWSSDNGYVYIGTIRRDGTVNYDGNPFGHEQDRIVRVDLSVRIREGQ